MSDQENRQPASDESERKADRQPSEQRGGRERSRSSRRRHSGAGGQTNRPLDQSLNMDELRELVELINEYGFTDFELENKDVRVRLRRELAPQVIASAPVAPPGAAGSQASAAASLPQTMTAAATTGTTAQAAAVAPPPIATPAEAAAAEEEGLQPIPSPIVGTFYRSPSPNAEPFVMLGSHVTPDTTVCIIEAMKLMNEIQAETTGTIAKIYVGNGQPVEYGQPLFGIKK